MNPHDIISGVIVKPLKQITNERGGLIEIQRRDDPIHPGFGQAYTTITFPHTIKAWYRHQKQVDQLIVLSGAMKLVLYDTQDTSSTKNRINVFTLTANHPTLIQIPPLVWHGFQSIDGVNLMTLHLNDTPHDFDLPDEERLSYNDTSIPYEWT